jgi:15-cis-phytoene synthase
MKDHFAYCENLVREADKDRFLAALFAPAETRPALFALYAFNIEVARVREVVREAMAGELRLQWWRDAIETGAGEASAHPVAAALREVIARYRLPTAPLLDLIEARSFDLYDDPMPTLAALEDYAVKTASALIDMSAVILGPSLPVMPDAIRHAGLSYAMTGLLRAFPIHSSRGQLYVPLELLERHGAKLDDVFAGRDTPELRAVLGEMRDIAGGHFNAYEIAAAAIPAARAPAFLPLALVPLYLGRLGRRAGKPFAIVEVPQWRRQWTLWRAARRA